MRRLVLVLLVSAVTGAACTTGSADSTAATDAGSEAPTPATPTTVPSKADPGFYVQLMWHQHQPFYPKDENGVYTRPWVRVHATKDYYDMAAMIERYPNVTATINLTPVLLLQLEDLANGAKDVYWVKSEIPADELSDEDKQFILERFFDANPKIIARFPRYQELADSRAELTIDGALAVWSDQDYRDLQVLFNLAWTDPDFLSEEPLASLVAATSFAESDKDILFAEHLRIIREIAPLHARLWDEGVIEVTTTPLAHPILPLIADTALATIGDPAAIMPDNRYQEIPDADQQVIRGLDVAERILGRRPVGMWPGEGSVAQLVMSLFSKNGIEWVATGEDVLAQSLGIGSFTRDGRDTVQEADLLYRPWQAQLRRNPPVPMFFRDVRISDQIGFEYSGSSGGAAAQDFMDRLAGIRDSVDVQAAVDAGRPYVVSVILDGENAWEHYPNDGKDFLDALYSRLSEADWVSTITPSEYLERFAEPETIDEVFPAAWFQPNFATWIGEREEAAAWDYLFRVRQDLDRAERTGAASDDQLAKAFEAMLFAEGSDWFWWYGSDQDSGDDGYFDQAYRELLGQVYDALGQERPAFVSVPIIPEQPVIADRSPDGLVTISIDGRGDWGAAGSYADTVPGGINWAIDRENLYLFVGLGSGDPFEIYLGAPTGNKEPLAESGDVLGFGATHLLRWDGVLGCIAAPVSGDECLEIESAEVEPLGGVELAVPLDALGALSTGDTILAKVVHGGRLVPADGPMAFQVPDISNVTVFLDIEDPLGDDHGPGGYTYPLDGVFPPGTYDLQRFTVGTEGPDLVMTFEVAIPIQNSWGSPRGLSVQTFDVYIDTDPGAGTGARILLPGRNAALEEGNGWEYSIVIEGWEPAVFNASPDGSSEETAPSFDVVTFGDQGRVMIRLPLGLLGDGDPTTWGYAAVLLSQEGFPSAGVRRVRDVEAAAEQWRLGGAPDDVNHTRIIDVAYRQDGVQEELLSDYEAVAGGLIDDLSPDDFGKVPLNLPR